tara:strand:+ start:4411 stop:4539 length:129 start_codon:yes stop_codon:yes gene_type:complete
MENWQIVAKLKALQKKALKLRELEASTFSIILYVMQRIIVTA